MNNLNKIKYVIFLSIINVLLIIMFFNSYELIAIMQDYGLTINYKENLNLFIRKLLILLLFFLTSILFYSWKKKYIEKNYKKLIIGLNSLKLNKIYYILIFFTLIYMFFLIYISVLHYDLGYDEAWYLHYAKNLFNSGYPYYTQNEKMGLIDIMTMLPYYISVYFYRMFFPKTIIGIKILSWILSLLGLFFIFRVVEFEKNRKFAFFVLLFIILQPGFGFVASSFFGEIFSIGLLFLAAYVLFRNKQYILAAFLFAFTIHTKFQLLPIVIASIILMYLNNHDNKLLKQLFFIVLFSFILILLRAIPVVLSDSGNIVTIIKQFYHLASSYHESTKFVLFDRIQLFNRFIPLILFIFIMVFSRPYLKTEFDKFIYIFTFLMIVYWIFVFKFTTYRHLFMGIIPLSYLFILILINIWDKIKNHKILNVLSMKIIIVFMITLFITYGTSANLIYAYVGYNDGVQFDLSGYKNRLFNDIKYDDSQKDFFNKIKKIISPNDVIYTPSPHVVKFYLTNEIYDYSFISIKRPYVKDVNYKKFIIIGRDAFPGGRADAYEKLDELNINYKQVYSNFGFQLLQIEGNSKSK